MVRGNGPNFATVIAFSISSETKIPTENLTTIMSLLRENDVLCRNYDVINASRAHWNDACSCNASGRQGPACALLERVRSGSVGNGSTKVLKSTTSKFLPYNQIFSFDISFSWKWYHGYWSQTNLVSRIQLLNFIIAQHFRQRGMDKMIDIVQTMFSNAFYLMETFVFCFQFHWSW